MTLLAAASVTADSPEFDFKGGALRLAALAALYITFTLVQRVMSRRPLFREIELTLNLTVLALLGVFLLGPHLDQMHNYLGDAVRAGATLRVVIVAVMVQGADGRTVTAAHLAEGAFFGEMSLLTGEPRSGTVTAETDVEVLCVSKQDFAGLLKADADLAGKLAAVLEKRMEGRRTAMAAPVAKEAAPETYSVLAVRIKQFFGIG